MKLFKWLRRSKQEPDAHTKANEVIALATATPAAVGIARSEVATHPLTTLIEPRDALLRFARDYLVASGAKVRVEESDLLTATLVDGRKMRYTTSLARARNEIETELLVHGGEALAALLDDCADRSRAVALHLWETGDPLALAQTAFATPLSMCPYTCAADTEGKSVRCEGCPQHDGKIVLAGFGPVVGGRELRRWEGRSVELTFHLISTDRRGRHDEWQRVAFDLLSKRQVPLLPLESPLHLEPAHQFTLDEVAVAEIIEHGQTLLAPAANALAAFLRLRSEADYQRRRDDVQTTYERLLREGGDEAEAIEDALQHELARLADTYTVEVEVQLDSIAFITSTLAEVALRDEAGASATVTTDLGRATVLPPQCQRCGENIQVGARCAHGHLLCATCAGQVADCLLCMGGAGGAGAVPVQTQPVQAAAISRSGRLAASDQLYVTQLEAMTPETWKLCASWLLERMGYSIEEVEAGEQTLRFSGHSESQPEQQKQPFVATVARLPKGIAIGAAEVRQAAALRAGAPAARAILLTTAPASREAEETAALLSVTLIARESLGERLANLEAAHMLAVAAEEQAATERATHAAEARTSLLAALDAMEDALARAVNTRKASGRAALVEAVETISAAQTVAAQVFIAWEALTTDWTASFGEHEARDGSLPITADAAAFDELQERAAHLGEVCRQAFERIQHTPGTGEMGYTAWRKAVLEELMARCEATRWRITIVNPVAWRDYAQARDTQALQQAEEATTAATYAHGRAEKARAQLQTRARIAVAQ